MRETVRAAGALTNDNGRLVLTLPGVEAVQLRASPDAAPAYEQLWSAAEQGDPGATVVEATVPEATGDQKPAWQVTRIVEVTGTG